MLPPSTTIRRYQRRTYARTIAEIGSLSCRIVSYANTQARTESEDVNDLVKDIMAVRAKLKKSIAIQTNITYEVSNEPSVEVVYLLYCRSDILTRKVA